MFSFDKFNSFKKQSEIVFKSRFLNNFSPMERYEFLQLCHRRNYKENEFIYYQGDPGTGMYFIEEGKVQLIAETGYDEQETITLNLDSPQSFGALSIGYELRRASSAKCLTDCTLLGFFKPDFETLRNRHPQIAVKFLETLSMIAMQQLERTRKALVDARGARSAFDIYFKTYYEETDSE
ncbi:MAG: cyclic nucleotide-binding domain-containing protein [Balneolaceae bacterium]|nr:cyclic nucleotide-binding domain-containing protein [Balneolaceae bacterium]